MANQPDPTRQFRRIGGISALLWVFLQIVGNALHPRLPSDSVESMHHISESRVWLLAHLILIFDYFVLIPMAVGISASLPKRHWSSGLTVPLIIIAATVGIVQVALHPTAFRMLADHYRMADVPTKEYILMVFNSLWMYNIAMEVGHLLVIYGVVLLFAIQMRQDSLFPRWIAWLGIAGGITAMASLIIGEVWLKSSVLGDLITFGIGLLPLAVWLVAVGITLLRSKSVLSPVPV